MRIAVVGARGQLGGAVVHAFASGHEVIPLVREDLDISNDHADIPKADAHKGPEEFRRRVIKGLGQPSSGRHKEAIRRYAEGLLR